MKNIINTILIILILFNSKISFCQSNSWHKADFPSYYDGEIINISAKDGFILAGSYLNGLAGSTNSGEHWFLLSSSLQTPSTAVLSSNILLALGYDGILMRSTDAGKTWEQPASIMFNSSSPILQNNNGSLFILGFQGIYRSLDSGKTWIEKNNGLALDESSYLTSIAVNSNGILVAATRTGIFKSTNNADSWVKVSPIGAFAVAVNSSGHIFARMYKEDFNFDTDTLYRSTDNGLSWQRLNPSKTESIFISPVDDAIIVFEYGDPRYYSISTDNGNTWNTVNLDGYPGCVTYDGDGNYFMGTYKLGILRSNSLTGPWEVKNTGFPGAVSQVFSLLFNDGKILAGTNSLGLFLSENNGNTFSKTDPITSYPLPITKLAAAATGSLFSIAGNSLFRSTDKGVTWNGYTMGSSLYYFNSYNIVILGNVLLTSGQLNPGSPGDAEVRRSTDDGITWTSVFKIQAKGYPYNQYINALAINPEGIVLGCVEEIRTPTRLGERYEYNYTIIRSTDFGATWSTVNSNLSTVPEINEFAWNSSNEIFAATSQGVLYSTDNGTTWLQANGSLPSNTVVNCIAISPLNNIYIGTKNKGVFESSDNGSTWNPKNDGLTDSVVNTLIISPGGTLFAGAEHEGVFRFGEPVTSTGNSQKLIPDYTKLYQNYPNPFNPSTVISFQLSVISHTTLKVYDILGNEVSTLVNEEKPAGSYKVEFDGSALSSGVYFYKLQTGSYTETRKLILMK